MEDQQTQQLNQINEIFQYMKQKNVRKKTFLIKNFSQDNKP